MSLLVFKIAAGFIVGVLIGMTGLGGGILLLPILIFVLRVPAIIAVGSDALINVFTKLPAGLMHLHKRTVRPRVVLALAAGSVPGSITGVAYLTHLRTLYGAGVNDCIKSAFGFLLLIIPTFLFFETRIENEVLNRTSTMKTLAGITGIGLIAGFLVGITSVGSGSIVMMWLLLCYSFPPKVMVGTDIVHAVLLTGVAGFLHFRAGNVDSTLVASLLIGSIPGGVLGSYLSTRVPVPWLRRILCALVLAAGARMLWA